VLYEAKRSAIWSPIELTLVREDTYVHWVKSKLVGSQISRQIYLTLHLKIYINLGMLPPRGGVAQFILVV